MEITRNVILDLMPLYMANEVSADTRALVEKYLETDPELAKIANQSAVMGLSEDIPIPLTEEDKMEAYREAKQLLFRRTVVWAALAAFGLLSCLGIVFLVYFMLVPAI